jgi:hypothetical protein
MSSSAIQIMSAVSKVHRQGLQSSDAADSCPEIIHGLDNTRAKKLHRRFTVASAK